MPPITTRVPPRATAILWRSHLPPQSPAPPHGHALTRTLRPAPPPRVSSHPSAPPHPRTTMPRSPRAITTPAPPPATAIPRRHRGTLSLARRGPPHYPACHHTGAPPHPSNTAAR